MATIRLLGTAAYPRVGETVHLLVRAGEDCLLVDAGTGTPATLEELGYSPGDVTDLFCTHSHADHLLGVPNVLLGRFFARIGAIRATPPAAPLTVRGNEATLEDLRALVGIVTPGLDELLADEDELRGTEAGDSFSIGDITATVLPAEHPVPTQGLCFEGERRVVYTADTTATPALRERVGSCDVVVHEAMYADEQAALAADLGHGTAREAGAFAEATGASELWLVHIADRYERPDRLRREASAEFDGRIVIPDRFDTLSL
ncbi:MBL fold metallo-hydrolase [Salinadaptatus halalkaliphilus]|uniref:MBL fold metallo-hydrolase n=1 Tax=Salinadaptatus halalkaliphilus TaxID=2419781 RepID=A0A4S3TIT9_9EURY|nr:MBL fold metallo-hydrolase [Salinadaptatus halalkaliphilus]THE63881.1 MBL fold metallo-hydrolase [Salinadaptatus halalkaliphilus]